MHTSVRGQLAVLSFVALLTACSGGGRSSTSTSQREGQPGVRYELRVQRPTLGNISSGADGLIDCGSAPAANRCGPVSVPWEQEVTLVANADPGYMFGTWVGDCYGRDKDDAGHYVCVVRAGADKFVGATFGPAGLVLHQNFSQDFSVEPTIHAGEFFRFVRGEADSFACDAAACHGADYSGRGIAPSCNGCHLQAGFPSWLTNCNFCHLSPPAEPHPPAQITGTPPPGLCSSCHDATVDADGNLVPGGPHMNGVLDGGGHQDGYAVPAVHGRDFFETAAVTPVNRCQRCHGANYDSPIVSPAVAEGPFRSCDTCHEAAGWQNGWETNCSFCHGERSATTQAGPYDVAQFPARASPPHAIQERLDGTPVPSRTGAHAAHLASTTDTVLCGSCHAVPGDLTHISGRDVRAEVSFDGAPVPSVAGQGYDEATGTCLTYCHDRNGASRSPSWTSTMDCDGCHAVPPATSAHFGLSGADLGAECAGCHPGTIRANGTIDPAGHINGNVESPAGHGPGFAARAVHGPQFLDYLASPGTVTDCRTCHAGYANCSACHASGTNPAPAIAWNETPWDQNCTFCHGARTPGYTEASLSAAAPPDSVNQRLTGSIASQATRIGKHREHLEFDGAEPLYPAFPCATCHPVPSDLFHVSAGPGRRAEVVIDLQAAFPALSPAEVAALPNGASYDPTTNRCSVYCHGSAAWGGSTTTNPTPTPLWSTAAGVIGSASCTACHGSPPPTGKRMAQDDYCTPLPPATDCSIHEWHSNMLSAFALNGCEACHDSQIHLDGIPNIHFLPRSLPGGGTVTGTWDRSAGTCNANCHTDPAIGLTPVGNPQTWR